MAEVRFRLYEELNQYLPAARRKREFSWAGRAGDPVGKWLATLGVPLGEVELILVDGVSVTADQTLVGGERVSVYPVFEALDVGAVARVHPRPLRRLRFVVGPGLPALCAHLRRVGFDTLEESSGGRRRGDRILLLPPGGKPPEGDARVLVLWSRGARKQVREVVDRLDLSGTLPTAPRCVRCNAPLLPREGDVGSRSRCPRCGKPWPRRPSAEGWGLE